MKPISVGIGIILLVVSGLVGSIPSRAQDAGGVIAERFRVTVTWRDHAGRTGEGFPALAGQSNRSAIFAFFDEDNWELLVKVLNGCNLNGHHWVFAAASTDVEYTLEVEDLESGAKATYTNPLGRAAPAITDITALDGCGADGDPFRLRRVGAVEQLTSYLKQGLEATYGSYSPYAYDPWGGFTGGPSGEPAGDPGGEVGLSQTNVQEAGVDEEDRVKSDGETLFILENHQSLRPDAGPPLANQIRILDLDRSVPSASAIADLQVAMAEGQYAHGMYLRSETDQLIVTASGYDYNWYYWYSPLAWLDAMSTVTSIDVQEPAQPTQGPTLELDGEIISSRRIDDVLYLATRFYPHIPGLEPYDPGGPSSAPALDRIEQATISELLPSYRSSYPSSGTSERRLLVEPQDCYLPTEDAPIRAADVITLVAIGLDSMEVLSSKCFVGATETIYVSLDSIYVATTRYDYTLVPGDDGAPRADYSQPVVETDLHKFALHHGAIVYRASGSVDGHLGWNIARKPFRLSELGNDLRVITYTGELTADSSPVAVTVLRDTGDDEFERLSRLPNPTRPEPIGKPGEELYATRFVGDRAYLVTFLVTDPLYVVDLSDPEDPFVAGELEITGYSDYLHPIAGGYLLGVGKDAIPDPFGDFRGAWYQGVKVALYDVRDPTAPFEVDAALIGKRGSDTPVLANHRAFTFLPGAPGRRPRIALGATVHERELGPDYGPQTFYGWSYSGLHLYEVDTESGDLVEQGAMVVEEYGGGGPGPIWGDDRSVLAGEAIFYVHGDDVHTGVWSNPGASQGPD